MNPPGERRSSTTSARPMFTCSRVARRSPAGPIARTTDGLFGAFLRAAVGAGLRWQMISKEERAELREQLSDEVPDNLWPELPDHAIALLDALDAADKRIADLTVAEDEYEENPFLVLNVSDGTLAVVQSRWRPIEEAPKDGKDWFIVARAGTPLRGPAYWFHGHWCQGNNAELHFTPTPRE
ncbi:hypothetical protein OUZ56_032642 [Daphnia magna]|uniref:Uncharacterized protein n=1 Tax=Daphnia magna TaxID=35525 RepID=A0ABR0B9H2_9CRUS|nr:hypothetical protein OUZ56_032642 [Daphnia magna]